MCTPCTCGFLGCPSASVTIEAHSWTAVRLANNTRCGEEAWLGPVADAASCMRKVLARPATECSHRFFVFADFADHSCACAPPGSSCTARHESVRHAAVSSLYRVVAGAEQGRGQQSQQQSGGSNDNAHAVRGLGPNASVGMPVKCDPGALRAPADATPSLNQREDIFTILEREGLVDGVELGVQKGEFAKAALVTWTRAKRYVMVDVWREQDHYVDLANVAQTTQDKYYEQAKAAVKFRFNDTRIEICRNFTTVMIPRPAPGPSKSPCAVIMPAPRPH